MKAESKQSLMVWAIVILAIMNFSTLATIAYHQYQSKQYEVNPDLESQSEQASGNFSGRYFRDKLNLSSNQLEKFREFNPGFRQQAREINIELAEKRKQMLEEMAKSKSDTSRLNRLSDSIGNLHSGLKKITYKYYLDLKNICDEAQQKQLEQVFSGIFISDVSMGMQGKGGQKRHQNGKRFNN
jgi:Spy/CpxP family protein refolding chaperone